LPAGREVHLVSASLLSAMLPMYDSSGVAQRKSDVEATVRFRSDRFFRNGGRWYFETRERKIQGPFEDRLEAQRHLEAYIRVESLDLYEDIDLELVPIDAKK
jgi:hypothetical protein